MPLTQPVVCPVLIGRESSTRALEEIRTQTGRGSGRVVLISGEAGIGKSRLLAELRSGCLKAGWQVLEGNCFEQDQALPYSAWTDLFRRCFAGPGRTEALRALGRSGGEIARLLPELADLPGVSESPRDTDPQQQKQRLVQEISQFLSTLTAANAVAVLIEDVHWADESTLDLLVHVARNTPSSRLLLVATYRSDEVGDRLGHTLAELDRLRVATEMALDRLESDEVREMLRATLGPGRSIRQDFAQTVYSLTEGNPFFIEEVLRSVQPDGAVGTSPADLEIPRSVREAVRRRFQGLGGPARRVAEYAAVAGRRFDFAVLRKICGIEEAELLELVKELIGAQLIVEEAGDQFSFRHALTREAIYSALLARERRALHGQIAATIEELNVDAPENVAADLAYHYFEAEAWAKALYYAAMAAAEADRVYAPRAAIEQYSRAIFAAGKLGQAPPSELHRGRGSAYEAIGEFERARADQERALKLARECGDSRAEWQALLDLGMLWAGRDYSRAGEYYKAAFELAKRLGDDAMRAHSMNRLGNWHINAEQPVESLHYHRQALQLFQDLVDKRGVAATLDLLGMSSLIGGDLVPGFAYLEEGAKQFRELGDRPSLSSALSTLTLYGRTNYHTQTMVTADYSAERALEANAESIAIARDIGWKPAESYANWNRGFLLGSQGRYAEALPHAKTGLALAEEIEHRQWMAGANYVLGTIYWDILAHDEAQRHLRASMQLAESAGTTFWIQNSHGYLASSLIETGDVDQAAAVLEPVFTPDLPARTIGERLIWVAAVELALARRDSEAALAGCERLEAFSSNREGRSPGPRISLLLGRALRAAGREAEAEVAVREGVETAQREMPGLEWRLLVELGGVCLELGKRSEAEEAFKQATDLILRLSGNVPTAYQAGFLSGAAKLLPTVHAAVLKPRPVRSEGSDPLTARERAVVALVAQGKSNRAIADELVLSERTVETHVSNILSKLGFSSRAQVAAWAVESRISG